MASLSFPDVNVWLALLLENHTSRASARNWWESDDSDRILFARFTQVSVLRLLMTAAAMNDNPLTMKQAWQAYDHLFEDDRVALASEPDTLEAEFRKQSASATASPKVWADAYLLAFSAAAGATLVTFDRALGSRSASCLVLE